MPPVVTIFKASDHLAMHAADLIAKSGLSIAMADTNHESQRDATYVTTSDEEEGFANAVERFNLPSAGTTGAET